MRRRRWPRFAAFAAFLTVMMRLEQATVTAQVFPACTAHTDCVSGTEACLNACYTAAFGGAQCSTPGPPASGRCQPCGLCSPRRILATLSGCGTCPTPAPTTGVPTSAPTVPPTTRPSEAPTSSPTLRPTQAPTTAAPTAAPVTTAPTLGTASPTRPPTLQPTAPTSQPSTRAPTVTPTAPTTAPTAAPVSPTATPTRPPTLQPTLAPTRPPVACSAGLYDSSGRCAACPDGTFSGVGATECTNCSAGCPFPWDSAAVPFTYGNGLQYIRTSCTAAGDRQCAAFRPEPCPSWGWIFAEPTATSDTVCRPCTQCPREQYAAALCSPYTNTVCTQCTAQCGAVQYEATPCTPTSDRLCLPLSTCTEGLAFTTAAATPTSDRRCANMTACGVGEVQVLPPTPTTDRVCAAASDARSVLCEPGMTWSAAADAASCQPVSSCSAGQYVVAGPTVSSDRRCLTCGHGTFVSEVQHTREACTPWTPCDVHHTEAAAGTWTSDRLCRLCGDGTGPRCPNGQYLAAECTVTTDRVCANCSGCSADSGDSSPFAPCTRTHDDVCAAPAVILGVTGGSGGANVGAAATTTRYRSDLELMLLIIAVVLIVGLLVWLAAIGSRRRRAGQHARAELSSDAKRFWWSLEEAVEVECSDAAKLRARRVTRKAEKRRLRDEAYAMCHAIVLEAVDRAAEDADYLAWVRRDDERSRRIYANHTLVARFAKAQRDIADKTTEMGSRHEQFSRRVEEAIEAARNELRLLEEVIGLSPDEVLARRASLEREVAALAALLDQLVAEKEELELQRRQDEERAAQLREQIDELVRRLAVAHEKAAAEDSERRTLSAVIDAVRAELQELRDGEEALRETACRDRQSALDDATAAEAATRTAAEAERHRARERDTEQRLRDLAEQLRLQREALRAELEEEARKVGWRAIQEQHLEKEQLPGQLGKAQMMLFGGGRIKTKGKTPARILGRVVVNHVVQDDNVPASSSARFDPDYVPSAEELERAGAQVDVKKSVVTTTFANTRVSEAVAASLAAKRRAAELLDKGLSRAEAGVDGEPDLDAAAEQRISVSIDRLQSEIHRTVLDRSNESTTAQQFASRAARSKGNLDFAIDFPLNRGQLRAVLGEQSHAQLFEAAKLGDVADRVLAASRTGTENSMLLSEFLDRIVEPRLWGGR